MIDNINDFKHEITYVIASTFFVSVILPVRFYTVLIIIKIPIQLHIVLYKKN